MNFANCCPECCPANQSAPEPAETRQRAILAEQALSDAKAMIEQLRADRDSWREQAQRLAGTRKRSKPRRRRRGLK
jgi:hypothetical protein